MRRLNVKLLLWLLGTGLVLVVGVFGLWTFQRSRTAGSLLERADQYSVDKKYVEAMKEYDRYFKFRKDDTDNYIRYASLIDEYSRLPDATDADRARAVAHLKVALVKDPSQTQLKRKVVDHLMHWRAYADAMAFLKELVQTEKDDAELEALLARCYVANNEIEQAVKLYQQSIEHDPKRVPTYVSLADVQRTRLGNAAEAEKTLDLAIERNPEDPRGYLARARANYEKKPESVKADVEKALSLAPTDPDAVLLATDVAIKESDVELARRRLDAGREANPDNTSLLITASRLEAGSDLSKAEEMLNEGIRRMPKAVELLFTLSELQLSQGDLEGAKKTLETMRKKQVQVPFLKFVEGRIAMGERNFERASRLFEECRAPLARTPYGTQVNTYLSQCYMSVGRNDRQLAAAQQAYESNPDSAEAKLTLAMAYEANRQRAEALKLYRTMLDRPAIQMKVAQMMVSEMADRTERERNWDDVDAFVKEIRTKGAPDLACNLLDAQVLKHRGQKAEAVQALQKNRDQHPEELQSWLALYDMTREVEGPEKSAQVLAAAIQKFGNTEQLRLIAQRDRLMVQENSQQAVDELKGQIGQMKDEKEKIQALLLLGEKSLRSGKPEEARNYYLQVAEMRPKDPSILVALFQLARIANNVSDMEQAVLKLRDIRGVKSYEYLFTSSALEITRLQHEVEKSGKLPGAGQKAKLIQVRQQLQAAEQMRSGSADLAQLDGELSQLEGDVPRAIDAYRKATTGSLFSPLMSKRLVQLLVVQGRYGEALAEIERLQPEMIDKLDLSMTRVELLSRTNKVDEALPLISKVVEGSSDWRRHAWAARMYIDANKLPEAEKELRNAVAAAPPEEIDPYFVLVDFLVKKMADPSSALAVIEEAKQKAAPDEQPLLLAKCYETMNDTELARRSFEQALAARPNDLRTLGGAIGFYLRHNQVDDALAMLDQMISAALSSTSEKDKQNAAWARRIKAQFLGQNGAYQNTLEAIELIDQNEKDGLASADDLSLKAALLSDRADRKSRLEAKEIFEKLIPMREDSSRERFALAKIYEREGDWNRARSELLAVLGQRGSDPRMVFEFCQMLLRHNEVGDVPRWLSRLEETSPNAPQTKEIRGRLLAVQGKKKEAADVLNSMVSRPVTADKALELLMLANIFQSLNMATEEEQCYREFYGLRPDEHLVLAGFLARRGSMAEVMELCQKAKDAGRSTPSVTQVAVGAIQSQPGAAREQDYQAIENWIQEGLKQESTSLILQMHLADFRYGQGRYDEAEKIYREFLARPDAVGAARAGALNNLSFVISLRDRGNPEKLAEALRMIDEAINLVGPISELLDTRGMVLLAQGNKADALKDLTEASTDKPTGIKLFHLALAQQAMGDLKGAEFSFRRARELGFAKEQVTSLELPAYNALEKALVSA